MPESLINNNNIKRLVALKKRNEELITAIQSMMNEYLRNHSEIIELMDSSMYEGANLKKEKEFDKNILLDMPPHLGQTLKAICKLGGEATNDEICEVTKRSRAVENGYLNALYRQGVLEKERKKGHVYYKLKIKL